MVVAFAMTELVRGCCVSVEFGNDGVVVRGRVHNIDRQAGLAILEENGTKNMVIVALPSITKVDNLPSTPSAWPDKSPVISGAGNAKASASLRAAAAEYARLPPPGVGADGQMAYDSLAKTLPCKWDDDGGISVLGGVVRVAPPYRISDISSNDKDALQRVTLILENERGKINSNSINNNSKSSSGNGISAVASK